MMKSMSWLLSEADKVPLECSLCGFVTRSSTIYRRHSRHCSTQVSLVTQLCSSSAAVVNEMQKESATLAMEPSCDISHLGQLHLGSSIQSTVASISSLPQPVEHCVIHDNITASSSQCQDCMDCVHQSNESFLHASDIRNAEQCKGVQSATKLLSGSAAALVGSDAADATSSQWQVDCSPKYENRPTVVKPEGLNSVNANKQSSSGTDETFENEVLSTSNHVKELQRNGHSLNIAATPQEKKVIELSMFTEVDDVMDNCVKTVARAQLSSTSCQGETGLSLCNNFERNSVREKIAGLSVADKKPIVNQIREDTCEYGVNKNSSTSADESFALKGLTNVPQAVNEKLTVVRDWSQPSRLHVHNARGIGTVTESTDTVPYYRCEECDFFSAGHRKYLRHMNHHTVIGRHTCTLCSYSANTRRSLHKHIFVDHGSFDIRNVQPDTCKSFNVEHDDQNSLTTVLHDDCVTSDFQVQGVYNCQVCNFVSRTREQYLQHANNHSANGPHKCTLCSFTATTCSEIRAHIIMGHSYSTDKIIEPDTNRKHQFVVIGDQCTKKSSSDVGTTKKLKTHCRGNNVSLNGVKKVKRVADEKVFCKTGSSSVKTANICAKKLVKKSAFCHVQLKCKSQLESCTKFECTADSRENNQDSDKKSKISHGLSAGLSGIIVKVIRSVENELCWVCLQCNVSYNKRAKVRRHVKAKHHISISSCMILDETGDLELSTGKPIAALPLNVGNSCKGIECDERLNSASVQKAVPVLNDQSSCKTDGESILISTQNCEDGKDGLDELSDASQQPLVSKVLTAVSGRNKHHHLSRRLTVEIANEACTNKIVWICSLCGCKYDERAKVRRHVKTKHRISMSVFTIVDNSKTVGSEAHVLGSSSELEDTVKSAVYEVSCSRDSSSTNLPSSVFTNSMKYAKNRVTGRNIASVPSLASESLPSRSVNQSEGQCILPEIRGMSKDDTLLNVSDFSKAVCCPVEKVGKVALSSKHTRKFIYTWNNASSMQCELIYEVEYISHSKQNWTCLLCKEQLSTCDSVYFHLKNSHNIPMTSCEPLDPANEYMTQQTMNDFKVRSEKNTGEQYHEVKLNTKSKKSVFQKVEMLHKQLKQIEAMAMKPTAICQAVQTGESSLRWTCLLCFAVYDVRTKIRRHIRTKHYISLSFCKVMKQANGSCAEESDASVDTGDLSDNPVRKRKISSSHNITHKKRCLPVGLNCFVDSKAERLNDDNASPGYTTRCAEHVRNLQEENSNSSLVYGLQLVSQSEEGNMVGWICLVCTSGYKHTCCGLNKHLNMQHHILMSSCQSVDTVLNKNLDGSKELRTPCPNANIVDLKLLAAVKNVANNHPSSAELPKTVFPLQMPVLKMLSAVSRLGETSSSQESVTSLRSLQPKQSHSESDPSLMNEPQEECSPGLTACTIPEKHATDDMKKSSLNGTKDGKNCQSACMPNLFSNTEKTANADPGGTPSLQAVLKTVTSLKMPQLKKLTGSPKKCSIKSDGEHGQGDKMHETESTNTENVAISKVLQKTVLSLQMPQLKRITGSADSRGKQSRLTAEASCERELEYKTSVSENKIIECSNHTVGVRSSSKNSPKQLNASVPSVRKVVSISAVNIMSTLVNQSSNSGRLEQDASNSERLDSRSESSAACKSLSRNLLCDLLEREKTTTSSKRQASPLKFSGTGTASRGPRSGNQAETRHKVPSQLSTSSPLDAVLPPMPDVTCEQSSAKSPACASKVIIVCPPAAKVTSLSKSASKEHSKSAFKELTVKAGVSPSKSKQKSVYQSRAPSPATSGSPQHIKRPHFSDLVKSLKSDDSDSTVKVRRLEVKSEVEDSLAASSKSIIQKGQGIAQNSRDNLLPADVLMKCRTAAAVALLKEISSNSLLENVPESQNCTSSSCENQLSDYSGNLENSLEDNGTISIPLKCAHCDYTSDRLSVLRRHLLSHVSERRYSCHHCHRSYKHEWTLTLHLRHAHEPKVQEENSPDLDSSGLAMKQANSHLSVEEKAAPRNTSSAAVGSHQKKLSSQYTCDLCWRSYKCDWDLALHKKNEHSETSEFSVGDADDVQDRCEKSVERKKRARSLDVGTASVHDEVDSELLCIVCNYRAVDELQLNQHVQTHQRQRDYWCPLEDCEYGTSWRCDMKKHLTKFHSDYLKKTNSDVTALIITSYRPGHHIPDGKINIGPQRMRTMLRKPKKRKLPTENVPLDAVNSKAHRKKSSWSETGDVKCSNSAKLSTTSAEHLCDIQIEASCNKLTRNDAEASKASLIRGINTRKVPHAERYRPFKCSVCGKRSNWRWDIKKHLSVMHPSRTDGHVIVLNDYEARCSLFDVSQSVVLEVKEPSSEHQECAHDIPTGTVGDRLEKTNRDVSQKLSLGMVDMLRLKRFHCTGCSYRSNHRGDVGRHIRRKHGRGTFKTGILSTAVAASTFDAYQSSLKCKRPLNMFSDASGCKKSLLAENPEDVLDHKACKAVESKSNEEPKYASVDSSGSGAPGAVRNNSVFGHSEKAPRFKLSEAVSLKAEESGTKKRSRDSILAEDWDDEMKYCDICPFRTNRTGLLELHKLRHRLPLAKSSSSAAPSQFFTCPHCPYYVHTSRQLERHLVLHSSGTSSARLDPATIAPVPVMAVGSEAKERYVCEHCPFVTFLRNEFWLHRRLHWKPADESAVQCDMCMFWTSDKRIMSKHLSLHLGTFCPRMEMTAMQTNQCNPVVAVKCYLQQEVDRDRDTDSYSVTIGLAAQSDHATSSSLAETKVEISREDCADQNAQEGPSCLCVLQCPYCYYSIASIRLLRQHVAFHIAFCDAMSTPLFDECFNNVADGIISVKMAGVRKCAFCRNRSCHAELNLDKSCNVSRSECNENNFFLALGLQRK